MPNCIKQARKNIGMTGTFLAKSAGISRAYLHSIESASCTPSDKVKKSISSVLGKKVTELFFFD